MRLGPRARRRERSENGLGPDRRTFLGQLKEPGASVVTLTVKMGVKMKSNQSVPSETLNLTAGSRRELQQVGVRLNRVTQ